MRFDNCLRYYIVRGGISVVEDGLHEPGADFGYAIDVRVYSNAQDRSLSRSIKVNRCIPVCGVDDTSPHVQTTVSYLKPPSLPPL